MKVKKKNSGFTLIELLVIVSLIALLSAMALIALQTARARSRDARRLSDMTQMNNGLELFFAENRGYPSTIGGVPTGVAPTFTAVVPTAPQAGDGACLSQSYSTPPVPAGYGTENYFYYPTGVSYLAPDGSTTVYSTYSYYFCLGRDTANFPAGVHYMTPQGVH